MYLVQLFLTIQYIHSSIPSVQSLFFWEWRLDKAYFSMLFSKRSYDFPILWPNATSSGYRVLFSLQKLSDIRNTRRAFLYEV